MGGAKQPRSAEQTARLLLSNAFRYDTWECNAAKREVQRIGGEAITAQVNFDAMEKQELPLTGLPAGSRVEAVNMILFDPAQRAFVGATHRCDRRTLHEPLVFQAAPKQVVAVELLVRDTRGTAALEEMRVTHWAYAAVESLGQPGVFALRPGNAHLLLLDEKLWPAASASSAQPVGSLTYRCKLNKDPALSELMAQLVPPGVFVSESFTKATPQQGGKRFRLVVRSIELVGTSPESMQGLLDPNADWSVAAVAHNGYQQLGHGAEVPLAIFGGETSSDSLTSSSSSAESSSSHSGDASSDSYYSYSHTSDKKGGAAQHGTGKSKKAEKANTLVLQSELPLEMDGLPVHAATSLVLAIRRRTPESKGFKVVGFCVFPLCVMPMRNRDVRVENLPALRGPFSCEDARMLMVDAASPYGRVPIAMTVNVEYHDLPLPPDSRVVPSPPEADAITAPPMSPSSDGGGGRAQRPGGSLLSSVLSASSSTSSGTAPGGAAPRTRPDGTPAGEAEAAAPVSVSAAQQQQQQVGPMGMTILSTADAGAAPTGPAIHGTAQPQPPPQQQTQPQPGGGAEGSSSAPGGDGIFRLLCTIMEELQRVRETQDAILRQTAPGATAGQRLAASQMSPEMQDRLGQKLADAPLDLIDLAPRPLAVSWQARREIMADVQPILHPTKGSVLDDNAPAAPGVLPASLFGIRFEGATLDAALTMPDDVCIMFSFGPLPYQQVGPLHARSVEKTVDGISESFKFYDSDNRGGMVWCEPTESLRNPAMAHYKACGGNATVYLHLYDALTMFYIATCTVPLSLFRRPYNAEAAIAPMDLVLQRDFSLTEQVVPPKIFPLMRNAGQLHVSLFCVGVPGGGEGGVPIKSSVMREPSCPSAGGGPAGFGNVIVAKKLPHVDTLLASSANHKAGGESPEAPPPPRTGGAADGSVDSPRGSPPDPSLTGPHDAHDGEREGALSNLHWQRAEFIKAQLSAQKSGSPLLPGVPDAHIRDAESRADMEFKLRYAEKRRSEAKTRAIAAALASRMTTQHEVQVVAWRPEVVRTPFQNPHSVPMQFTVDVPAAEDKDLCEVVGGAASFFLGPRERTEIPLVIRMYPVKNVLKVGDTRVLKARVYSERREVMRYIEVKATLAPPLVDRRYELFGPAGSTLSKKIFTRVFSSSSFPITSNQRELLARMRDLCLHAATSSRTGRTTVETNAVLDPITQTYVTAWEETTIHTVIPAETGRQRTEYVTLFLDADMTRVYETWELSLFPCECLTSREISWGQTTALGLPAAGTEAMYCDPPTVRAEQTGASYVLRVRPKEAGSQRLLLHTLTQDGTLRKTLLTVPVVNPTPSFTQVIELSLADVADGPVFRRLTFRHRGDAEEVFQVHHNYRYQLKLSPARFALAPGDSQFISLQFDALVLPPGQLEGRWPMWIFINNAQDKTVESYYLQVVLRAHPVVPATNPT